MQIVTSALIESIVNDQKRKMEGILPELIKRLIISSCSDCSKIRMPSGDDIWAHDFDGVVINETKTRYVNSGQSVWEFGTSSDSLAKINNDYEKRTKNSNGIIQEDTVFYLITPKIWAYSVSITEWEVSHSGPWKEVRVYDASVLCDWINSEPVVCAWLLENFTEIQSIEFSTVSGAWTHFANMTIPAMSHSLFTIGRNDEIKNLTSQIKQKKPKVCCIHADIFYDALGFCITTLLQNNEMANNVIAVNNEKTYRTLSDIVKGKIFLLMFPFQGNVSDNNYTIICQSREQKQRHGEIQLSSLWKTQFEQALIDMGFSSSKANELYKISHGNLLSLIRYIPGNISYNTPEWANAKGVESLYPMVFMRSYNTKSEIANRVISMLSDDEKDKIKQTFESFLRMEDAPIKRVDEWFVITNYEEAWLTLRINLSDVTSERLYKTILYLLDECAENFFSDQSDEFYIIKNLLFNYIYFSETGSPEYLINKQVKTIIEYIKYTNCQRVLLNSLPDLAEAAPLTVIDFLESLFTSEQQPLFEQLCCQEKTHYIIWALGHLVKYPDTAIQACKLILHLSQNQAVDFPGVAARDLLLNTLCLWDNHTPILIQDKVTILLNQIQNNPDFGIPLVIDLLDKRSIILGVRIGVKERTFSTVSVDQLNDESMKISLTAFKAAIYHKKLIWIEDFLSKYWLFSCDALAKAAQEFCPKDYSSDQLVLLLFHIHKCIYNIHKYHENDYMKWVVPLQIWVERLIANDPIIKVAWMFSSFSDAPFQSNIELETDDFYEIKDHNQAVRIDIFSSLKEDVGLKQALQLTNYMEDNYDWGEFLGKCITESEVTITTQNIIEQGKYRILSGFFDSISLADAKACFFSVPKEIQYPVIDGMYRTDIKDWLESPELQRSYWQKKRMNKFDEWTYKSLLQYNPCGILPAIYQRLQENPGLDDMILEVFQAIANSENVNDKPLIKLIIEKVDICSYTDKWAEICLQLVKKNIVELKGYDDYYPECLKKYFFIYPEKIHELYINDQQLFYMLFVYSYQLPDTAFCDYNLFRTWSDCLYEKIHDNHVFIDILCYTFAKSPKGQDGIFPHEFVRMLLEYYSDSVLSKEVAISYLNSRGARVVTDGLQENKKAEEMRQISRNMELRYPQTAAIIRYIANDYTSESRIDRMLAEIEYF